MKRMTWFGLVLLSVFALAGVVSAQEEGTAPEGDQPPAAAEEASAAPAAWDVCSRCHNADGSPTRIGERFEAPHLGSAEVQARGADGIRAFIAAGENHRLSADDAPTGADLDAVVEYVLTLSE